MKILKKLIAVVLVCLMVFSITGCHKKDEIAVTINGYEFTSAYYMCALINSYMEAQQLVYNDLTDEELQATSIDYFSKKIEDKKFEQWVKDDAIETLKETAYYKTVCDKAELKISDEDIATNEYYASMYWASYGYSEMFEPNGVSQATFTKYMNDSYYAELYFEHLYGKDGEKEISAKTVKNKLYDDFLIADILEFTKGEETTSELNEITKKFKNYAKKLESGDMTFEEVYNDYNDVKETEKEEEHSEDDGHDHKEPKDAYASIIGDEGTGKEHDYYSKIKKLDVGEVKLYTKDNNEGYVLVVKQDIKADDYYLDTMDMTIRHLLKDEEYTADMVKEATKLEPEINNYAVKQFKVKKIKEPSYAY